MDNETPINEELARDNQEFLQMAEAFYNCFQQPFGHMILDHLDKMTKEQSFLVPNGMMDCQATITPSDFVFIREGQGQVVRYIVNMLKFYEENK